MNLYDKDDGFRCFGLQEANALLPEIIARTEQAIAELEQIEEQLEEAEELDDDWNRDESERKKEWILDQWAQDMVAFGVYPKGYFTVDFKSPIPDTLFCWTYGEDEIRYSHKVYETFKDRRPIGNSQTFGFEEHLN